ncbi:MAG: DUF305 domain-containing protein [Dermatophilaceae bacterium]
MPTTAMPDRPTRAGRGTRVALAASVLVLALAGCTDEGRLPPATGTAPDVPVLQPGAPGEPNRTLTGPEATPAVTPTASAADARFLQQMIVHHSQAVVMVDAVATDLADAQVAALASRIADEQRPEIRSMAIWLEGRGQSVPPEATNPLLVDHDSHSMPGMASDADIQRLAVARGGAADRLFLTLMVRHHQGALEMVDRHVRITSDPQVEKTAAEVFSTQSKQIRQMQEMFDRLS